VSGVPRLIAPPSSASIILGARPTGKNLPDCAHLSLGTCATSPCAGARNSATIGSSRFTTPGSTADHLSGAGYEVTIGIGPDLLENVRAALRRMVELISSEQNLAPIDVYLLTSVCADMRLSQVVDEPNWIVSCYFPRIVFEHS
jgi:hypothetical protein